jgi:hypothetical protein
MSKSRPSPAMIVAMAALVMAMSGAAIALPGKGKVQTNDLQNSSVTKKKIAKGAVGSAQIVGKSIKGNRLKDGAVKSKQLAENAVTSKKLEAQAVTADKVKDGSLTGKQVAAEGISSGNISDYAVIGTAAGPFHKLTATDAGSEAAGRSDAPATTLFKKGQLAVTAKCFRDTVGNDVYAEVYIESAADGATFTSFTDGLFGGNAAADFLNDDTALADRQLAAVSTGATSANMGFSTFGANGVDGTSLNGQVTAAAKNGVLAGGNGVYGDGNVCIFSGQIAG